MKFNPGDKVRRTSGRTSGRDRCEGSVIGGGQASSGSVLVMVEVDFPHSNVLVRIFNEKNLELVDAGGAKHE